MLLAIDQPRKSNTIRLYENRPCKYSARRSSESSQWNSLDALQLYVGLGHDPPNMPINVIFIFILFSRDLRLKRFLDDGNRASCCPLNACMAKMYLYIQVKVESR